PSPSVVVEDDRPGSGHMQVNHPAPCEGFFEPAAELGQRVKAGDLLGTVTDLLGTRVEPVRAAYAGLILVLHTFARVGEGERGGVVLEAEWRFGPTLYTLRRHATEQDQGQAPAERAGTADHAAFPRPVAVRDDQPDGLRRHLNGPGAPRH